MMITLLIRAHADTDSLELDICSPTSTSSKIDCKGSSQANLTLSPIKMIASLLLLTLPFAFANPLPTSSAATSIAPAPTSPPVVRGFSASLSHGQGAIARTKAYENVKTKRGFFSRDVENDDSSLPPSWLLWAGARVDSKYNEGKGGFAAAYALALSKRAQNGEIT